jgi:hypothetical protein
MGGGCWGTPIAMGCCSGVTAADCSKLGYRLGYWLEYWLDAATPFVSIAHRNLLGFLHCDDRKTFTLDSQTTESWQELVPHGSLRTVHVRPRQNCTLSICER